MRLNLRFLLIALIFSMFVTQAVCQNHVLIRKPGKVKRIKIERGDYISFKLKGDDHWYGGYIEEIYEESIKFHNWEIKYTEIGKIKFPISQKAKVYSTTLMSAGVVLFVVDQLNNADVTGSVSPGIVTASVSMFVVGYLLRFVKKRRYNLEKGWIMHTMP